jgi:hypothetical protein
MSASVSLDSRYSRDWVSLVTPFQTRRLSEMRDFVVANSELDLAQLDHLLNRIAMTTPSERQSAFAGAYESAARRAGELPTLTAYLYLWATERWERGTDYEPTLLLLDAATSAYGAFADDTALSRPDVLTARGLRLRVVDELLLPGCGG